MGNVNVMIMAEHKYHGIVVDFKMSIMLHVHDLFYVIQCQISILGRS